MVARYSRLLEVDNYPKPFDVSSVLSSSCNPVAARSPLNTMSYIEINKNEQERSFSFNGKKEKIISLPKNSVCKFGSIRIKECITA